MNNDYSEVIKVAEEYRAVVLYDEPMSRHTSFRIGGCCDVMVCINSEELLSKLIRLCRKSDIRYFVLGKGTNILVSDKGLKGVVLYIGSGFSDIEINGEYITCEAGATLVMTNWFAMNASLTGLEFSYGIPGSVGGAVYMNAGAFGGEMKDVVVFAKYIDEDGEIHEIKNEDMQFGYRSSIFSKQSLCVTKVTFKLSQGDKEKIKETMLATEQKRKDKQPLEYPSAGSTFKRPEGAYASQLIENCGLKGFSCGGAQVSEKHSGFVINKGSATFDDVLNVVAEVKRKVKEETGISLECEMLIIE